LQLGQDGRLDAAVPNARLKGLERGRVIQRIVKGCGRSQLGYHEAIHGCSLAFTAVTKRATMFNVCPRCGDYADRKEINAYLRANAATLTPSMGTLDTGNASPDESAAAVIAWIKQRLR
jgi:hypothetical protein